jgi:hypothetical protein
MAMCTTSQSQSALFDNQYLPEWYFVFFKAGPNGRNSWKTQLTTTMKKNYML